MIHTEVLIRPYKSPGNHEMYSTHKSYGIKHKKSQTRNLSVAVAREKKLLVEREKEMKSKQTRKSKGRKRKAKFRKKESKKKKSNKQTKKRTNEQSTYQQLLKML